MGAGCGLLEKKKTKERMTVKMASKSLKVRKDNLHRLETLEDVKTSDAEIAEDFLKSHPSVGKKEARLEHKWDQFIFRHRDKEAKELNYVKALETAAESDR